MQICKSMTCLELEGTSLQVQIQLPPLHHPCNPLFLHLQLTQVLGADYSLSSVSCDYQQHSEHLWAAQLHHLHHLLPVLGSDAGGQGHQVTRCLIQTISDSCSGPTTGISTSMSSGSTLFSTYSFPSSPLSSSTSSFSGKYSCVREKKH
jgi:hypothetical protein